MYVSVTFEFLNFTFEYMPACISFSLVKPVMVNVNGFAGGCTKAEEEEGQAAEEDPQAYHGEGVCKWFNVRMGFGFLSMSTRDGVPLESPVDVFVHQVCVGLNIK